MKLHEIVGHKKPTDVVTVEPAGGIYGEFDVQVEYDYEPASFTQHEPDNSSFREHHPAQIDIISIKLNEKVWEIDEDGEKTQKFWEKGFDATKLPGWNKSDDEFVADKIADAINDQEEDFDEPDDYRDDDRHWP